jgi:chemotaxis protein MotB
MNQGEATTGRPSWRALALCATVIPLLLSGCVTASRYNSMVAQRNALETSLRGEINADQVKIEELENGIRVRMTDDLLYVPGSVELHAKGRAALAKVASQLASMAAQDYDIDVVGNTDDVPVGPKLAERYPTNWELAAARAAAVVRFLQELGVDPTKLQAVSAGQYHPVASNDTVAGRAQNRRTDILVRPH